MTPRYKLVNDLPKSGLGWGTVQFLLRVIYNYCGKTGRCQIWDSMEQVFCKARPTRAYVNRVLPSQEIVACQHHANELLTDGEWRLK